MARVGCLGNKRGAHEEENDGKAAAHLQKVISESVGWSRGSFGAIVITAIDGRKECSWNGESQDTVRFVSMLMTDEKECTHPTVRSV